MLAGHVVTKQLLAACLCLVLSACRAAAAPPAASLPDVVAQVTHSACRRKPFLPENQNILNCASNTIMDGTCRLIRPSRLVT